MRPVRLRIAAAPKEASSWKENAVAVDVLRASTTLCALLAGGCPEVRIYADRRRALAAARRDPAADFFSELELGLDFQKHDNSPHLALTRARPSARAILITGAGTPALLSLRKAAQILVGCFANLPAVTERMRADGGSWLIVPACLFLDSNNAEDLFCAEAIRDRVLGKDTARDWAAKVRAGRRPEEFLAGRPDTGRADLKLALSVGRFPVVPSVVLKAGHGVVKSASRTADS